MLACRFAGYPMRLPLAEHAPGRHQFCRPAFDAHVEVLRHRFWRFIRSMIVRTRNAQFRRIDQRGFLGRLRELRSGNKKAFGEILGIEPPAGAQALRQAIVPQAGDLNVEDALQPLVDRLHAVAGDRPLPADPIDVAMQGHFCPSFPERLTTAPNQDYRGPAWRIGYRSLSTTFSPPI